MSPKVSSIITFYFTEVGILIQIECLHDIADRTYAVSVYLVIEIWEF